MEGAFTARVRIVNINASYVGSMWYYGFGLIKAQPINGDGSYYSDSALWFSNGQLNVKYQGSNGTQLFTQQWKIGDEIALRRDEQNNLYFGFGTNESAMMLGHTDVSGPHRIVLGFMTSVCIGDIFELIEIVKTN